MFWHRTETVDYSMVLSGEIDVEFDSGQVVTMKQGEIIVMRGVTHCWKNKGAGPRRYGFYPDRRRSLRGRRREEGRTLSGLKRFAFATRSSGTFHTAETEMRLPLLSPPMTFRPTPLD